ncbi:MAG TPA: DUF4386 domain-containing protein [Candidatus Dormibacteraeota bacterium]|nr:DUF4386 domain-containing protein [Candidatus Dormibacteraeota bacterium]
MKPYRGNAIAVGVLLIACSAAAIVSAIPLGSTLDGSGYLSKLAVNGNAVVLTALIQFLWAATAVGIAVGLYPVLRKYNRSLALGAVVGRTVEGMLILVGTVSLLALFTLSQGAGTGAAPSYQAVGSALLAVRDWGPDFLGGLSFGTAALMYYYLLYRSRLVPRWLSGWGLIGAGLSIGMTVYSGFTQEFGVTTVSMVVNIPGLALQEMVLAIWLIVKGFKPSAFASVASAGGSGGRS